MPPEGGLRGCRPLRRAQRLPHGLTALSRRGGGGEMPVPTAGSRCDKPPPPPPTSDGAVRSGPPADTAREGGRGAAIARPQWPNGQGTGLLSQGLWVRVPPGVIAAFLTPTPGPLQQLPTERGDVGTPRAHTDPCTPPSPTVAHRMPPAAVKNLTPRPPPPFYPPIPGTGPTWGSAPARRRAPVRLFPRDRAPCRGSEPRGHESPRAGRSRGISMVKPNPGAAPLGLCPH